MEKQYKNRTKVLGGTKNPVFREKDWYKEKIIKMVNQIDNETTLKKIYTFSKTLNDISKEEGV